MLLAGCRGNDFQSSLHPASDAARHIEWLWWWMVAVYGGVFLVTLALAVRAVTRRKAAADEEAGAPGGATRFVMIAGVVVPSLILLAMLVVSLGVHRSLKAPETDLTLRVRAHQWWWHVEYVEAGVVSANEIRVPVGTPVRLELTSADVIHSFWVPNLHGKMDMVPDHINRFWFRADRAGVYRGTCAEFCGSQHALMGIDIIAMPPGEFERWLAEKRRPPQGLAAPAGKAVFFSAGCAACHAIGGTEAVANIGPDLTHLAERINLAASTLPNTPENLSRWIRDPQSLKPGNFMPPTHLDDAALEALVDYLQTLR